MDVDVFNLVPFPKYPLVANQFVDMAIGILKNC